MRTILNGDPPVWLSLKQKTTDTKNPLAQTKQGLNWAQILGDAAKNGFKAIFAPINRQTWYDSSMSYYITLLHKRIIGQTVFDTKMFNGNRFDSHFYGHCTKNMSGSFSIFGVNAGDSKLEITAKVSENVILLIQFVFLNIHSTQLDLILILIYFLFLFSVTIPIGL